MPRTAAVLPSSRCIALLLSLVGVGCLQPTAEGDSVPLAQWCTESVNDYLCHLQIACGTADADAGCDNIGANSRLASAPDPCSPALLASLDAGTVHYDGRAALRCLQDGQTVCGGTASTRLDCAAVFVGAAAEAAPCNFDEQCSADLWCSFEANVCPGACRARVGPGGVTTVASACATDLSEPLDGGAFRCVDYPQLGQPCSAAVFCQLGLHCEQGICAASLEVGAACTASSVCVAGTSCVDGHCRAFARRGAPCASQYFPTNPTASPCLLGLACRAGTCGGALRAGESCNEEPNRCGADTRCDLTTSLCAPLAPAGAACTSASDCVHPLLCTAGTCRAAAALGEPCDATTRCEPTRTCLAGVCVTSARECR